MKLITSLLSPILFVASLQLQAQTAPEHHVNKGLSMTLEDGIFTILNESSEYLIFYPNLWFSAPKAVNGKDEKHTLYNTMEKFSHYPVAPIVPTATNDAHVPFNAYNFFGIAICDDSARFFSAMLS